MQRALLAMILLVASNAHAERGDDLAPAYADPPWRTTIPRIVVGVVGLFDFGVANTASLELAAAVRVLPWLYLDGQAVLTGSDFFTEGGSIDHDAMYGGALGASVRHWRDLTMVGAHLMAGYSRFDYTYESEDYRSSRSDRGLYAELAGLAALRITPWVALELRVDVRQWVRTEGSGRTRGGGAGVGLHVTF